MASPAAATPTELTHAITLRGARLTEAILAGIKRVENRSFKMKPGWYALHTGAKTSSHESQEQLLDQYQDIIPNEIELPHSSIVGAIQITHNLTMEDCDNEPWAFGPTVNVIGAVIRLAEPVAHKGALGMWPMNDEAREKVISLLQEVTRNDVSHLLIYLGGQAFLTPHII